ncbi:methyltransferase domain-containing protein [Tropicimonas sp. TH_r6]|uniref:class I SAM-dependent methyltransferase n=1 Tax=Tropicimonas sp. TH_r6 TaxID=3082085 RepID=UPI0029547693|nr:methyltransferase domain-containing protein [Tropicimonas sp. TH_r6]MDV7144304.1 methyltransferase domain-containing protein [Tropicimonas sp. TH_r6]
MLRKLIDLNKRLSERFDRLFPAVYRIDGNTEFRLEQLPALIEDGQKIYDLGGGSRPYVSVTRRCLQQLHVVGVDISAAELNAAPDGSYDETIALDAADFRGVGDGDLAISQAALEHTEDTQAAILGIASSLRPGGVAAIFTPCRNAAFARLNILLPEGVKRRILLGFFPEKSDGHHGFPALYRNCTPSKMLEIAQSVGLSPVKVQTYWCSNYFTGIFPLHVLWRLWTVLAKTVFGPDMCETFVLILIRQPQDAGMEMAERDRRT